MFLHRHAKPRVRRYLYVSFWTALVAGILTSSAYAASFGHSRLVSRSGQPLRIDVPVTQASAAELASLQVSPANPQAWRDAGLTPPVDLSSLRIRVTQGMAAGTHLLQVSSDQVFNQPIADLLLDVHTSTGTQRYQVSLLAQGGGAVIHAPAVQGDKQPSRQGEGSTAPQSPVLDTIPVRLGDNMFIIARQNAVSGVTVYQMMVALQRANPNAFIHNNLNLVKAGSTLTMPDSDALTALSDREARRLFHQQLLAFNKARRTDGSVTQLTALTAGFEADPHEADQADGLTSNLPDATSSGDQLKLSNVGRSAGLPVQHVDTQTAPHSDDGPDARDDADIQSAGSQGVTAAIGKPAHASTSSVDQGSEYDAAGVRDDDRVATQKAIEDTDERVSQLEENVKNLNKALRSQGEAAKDLVVDGALGLRQSLTDVASAVTDATIGDEDSPQVNVSPDKNSSASLNDQNSDSSFQDSSSVIGIMPTIVTWVQTHLFAASALGLALLVLIITWVLKYLGQRQSRSSGAVTPEMVQEKLDQINLDLDEPVVGDSTPPRT